MQFPVSNLPPAAQKWGKFVEKQIQLKEDENQDLRLRLGEATAALNNANDHATLLQNYLRTICLLGGYAYPPQASDADKPGTPPVIVPPTPAKTVKTVEVGASWSCSWGSGGYKYPTPGGSDTDSNSLYQRGSGAKFAMWRFDIGAARGKKIVGAEIYLSNVSTYYNGAFTAILGTHGNTNEPASRPGGRTNGFDVGWQARQGKWVALGANLYGGLSTGAIQGFTLGDTQSGSSNYARFNGVGRTGAPRIRIKYEA